MAHLDPHELLEAASCHPAIAALRERCAGGEAQAPLLLVGGAVRDLVLGRSPGDLDVMVEGRLEPVLAAADTVLRRHRRFETATVRVAGEEVDLARARREIYPRPGALPVVEPAGAEADLARRDFTVNALALGLTGHREGALIAVPGAEEDLDSRWLRVLHPGSFRDDPTRLLRLARYRSRLGFNAAPHTAELVRAAREDGALRTISAGRIGRELRLLAAEDDPVSALLALEELALDAAIARGFGLRDAAMARSALGLLPAAGRADLLVIGAAALGVDPEELDHRLRELEFPRRDRARLLDIVRRSPRDARALAAAVGGDSLRS